jgi:Flp pilus assembly pilin Flp
MLFERQPSCQQRGQILVEYSLIVLLIALIVLIVIALMGTQLSGLYSRVVSNWPPS